MVLNGVIGRIDRNDSRWYVDPADPEIKLWSVTTVLGATESQDHILIPWAAKLAAEFTVDHLDVVNANAAINKKAAVDLIKGQAKLLRELKADIGTYQHDVMETLILDHPIPATPKHLIEVEIDGESVDLDVISEGHLNFDGDFAPEWIMAEATVANPELGISGTLDGGAYFPSIRIPGRTKRGAWICLDLKTGRYLRDKDRAQIVTYKRMTEVWVDNLGNKERMPQFDLCGILHVRPEFDRGYKLYIIPPADEQFYFNSFLAGLERFKHIEEAKPKRLQVMYPPLDDGSQPLPMVEDVEALGLYRKPLKSAGIETIGDIAEFDVTDLLKVKGLGKKAPDVLRAVLRTYGKTMKGEVA